MLKPPFIWDTGMPTPVSSFIGDHMHLISCARCGKIHPWGECPLPKPSRYTRGEKTAVQKWRSTAQWQHKTEQIRDRDMHMCKMCLAEGCVNTTDLSVHHIIPITKDETRRLDDDNLILLCRKHHDLVEGNEAYTPMLLRLATIPPGKLLENGPDAPDRTAPPKKQTFP